MKLETLHFGCFVILLTSLLSQVSGRSIDEIIAGASETTDHYPADKESGTVKRELDMILTLEQYNGLQEFTSVSSTTQAGRPKRKATRNTNYRWTNNVIPYKIVSNIFSDSDMAEINAAIAEWQNYTCLSFRTANSSDVNYVIINNVSDCSSRVGMIGGPQNLSLAARCRVKRAIVHEMGHVVGFHHEQNRPDRDDFVTIKKANIPANKLHNFNKYSRRGIETYGVPYDYRSVMHYGGTAFSFNGEITIQTNHAGYQNVIGNSEGLSFFDIKLANLMYNCSSKCGNVDCPQPGLVGKDCKCWCPGSPVQSCLVPRCMDWGKNCELLAKAGYCKTNFYVWLYCMKSCNRCNPN